MIDSIENCSFNLFDLNVKKDNLQIAAIKKGFDSAMILSDVQVFGLRQQPQIVTINQQKYNDFTFDDINMVKIFSLEAIIYLFNF